MTAEAFVQIMNPLQEKYPKDFIPETMRPLYAIMGHLTIDQGRDIIGKLILRSRFAPREQDFREAVHELFRPKQFIKPIEDRFDRIFSDDEREEIWKFIKEVAVGAHSKNTIDSFTSVLNEAIRCYYKR